MTQLSKAIVFATLAHQHQRDKGDQPYILHPLRIMLNLHRDRHNEDVLVTALLHDVLEDTKTKPEEISDAFGSFILEAVQSVSRITEPEKELYFDFIRRSKANPIGRIVKIYDIQDNMLPNRVAQLPEGERGVVKRYEKALKILREEENERQSEKS